MIFALDRTVLSDIILRFGFAKWSVREIFIGSEAKYVSL